MQLFINIDGGSRGNPGPGASACVIKDKKGVLLKAEGLFWPQCTNNQAEFNALKLALQRARALGGTELYIKADSQLLVKQFLGEYKIKNPQLKDLMAEIKQLCSYFKKINIQHVPREQNKEPDLICNQTMDKALKRPLSPQAPINNQFSASPQQEGTQAQKTPEKKEASGKKGKKSPIQLELFDLNNL